MPEVVTAPVPYTPRMFMPLGAWFAAVESTWPVLPAAVGIVALALLVLLVALVLAGPWTDATTYVIAALGCALAGWVGSIVFPPLMAWGTGMSGNVGLLVVLTLVTVGLFAAAGALLLVASPAVPEPLYAVLSGFFYLVVACFAFPGVLRGAAAWMAAFV